MVGKSGVNHHVSVFIRLPSEILALLTLREICIFTYKEALINASSAFSSEPHFLPFFFPFAYVFSSSGGNARMHV